MPRTMIRAGSIQGCRASQRKPETASALDCTCHTRDWSSPVRRTPLRMNPRSQQPNLDDYYPAASKRLGEEGIAAVKVCVDDNGRVVSATLSRSSGADRLDEAAVKVARVYKLIPPTENGKPVAGCGDLPVRFKLTGG